MVTVPSTFTLVYLRWCLGFSQNSSTDGLTYRNISADLGLQLVFGQNCLTVKVSPQSNSSHVTGCIQLGELYFDFAYMYDLWYDFICFIWPSVQQDHCFWPIPAIWLNHGALGLYPHFRVIQSVEAVTTSEETSGAAAQKVAEAVMKASEPLGPWHDLTASPSFGNSVWVSGN